MIPSNYRRAASSHSHSQSQLSPEQNNQSLYYTAPVFDLVRRDYNPSCLEAGVGIEYQTATAANATANAIPIKTEFPAASYAPTMKRNAVGEPDVPVKQPKTERPEEFSKQVKAKLQTSSRTGQACDRCKIRKIRCDGLLGGCSPCLQNNTDCVTTDRITGKAQQRGYVEGIEHRNRELERRVQELEQQLMNTGVDVKPSTGYDASYGYNQSSSTQAPAWSPVAPYPPQNDNALTAEQHDSNTLRAAPFRVESTGDNFLGVSPGNSHLSSIKGTALSILGMTIDIADFKSADMDEPDLSMGNPQLYNKSYQSFLQSALNINHGRKHVDLPPRHDAFQHADWYFGVINPFNPLLHRPTFMKSLTSCYDDPTYRPTTAEKVILHMVFAIMYFQISTRNLDNPVHHEDLTEKSNMHYHHSLGMFYQLSVSHTAHDVQALTLICSHLRNFPKPGAGWIFTQTTMSLAIEIGLNRSADNWAGEHPPDPLEVEMRKRTWWALLAIHVTLAGKLGRPMTVRSHDFDVEMPEEVDDELLSAKGLDTSRPGECAHKIGLVAFRLVPIFLEMYDTIYAVHRQPDRYMSTVKNLEVKLRAWKESCPPEFVSSREFDQGEHQRSLHSLYAETWECEFLLLLRHPSVEGTTDAAFRSESMRICVESSRQMLSAVRKLRGLKSLDTTWYQSAVYVMAITTTLFAKWEKRNELTAADLNALREEMDLWLDIMGEVGTLLGSGIRLREAVRNVTEGTLSLLNRHLPSKPSFGPNHGLRQSKSPPQLTTPISGPTYSKPSPTYSYDNSATGNVVRPPVSNYITDTGLPHQQTPYPQATQYQQSYPDPSNPSNIAYTPQDTQAYSTFSASRPHEAPLLTTYAPQANQVSPDSWQQRVSHIPDSSAQAWHHWTNTMTNSLEPQETFSVNALMDMHHSTVDLAHTSSALSHTMGTSSAGVMDQGQLNAHSQWPMNLFGPSG